MIRDASVIGLLFVALVVTGCTRNNDSTPSPTEAPQPTRTLPDQSPVDPFDLVATIFPSTPTVAATPDSTPTPRPTLAPSPTPFPSGWESLELPEAISLDPWIFKQPDGSALVLSPDRDLQTFRYYSLDVGSMEVRQGSEFSLPLGFIIGSVAALEDGRLVFFGGDGDTETYVFSAVTGALTAGPELVADRFVPTAIQLPDGGIAFAGTSITDTRTVVEIYDEVTGTLSEQSKPDLPPGNSSYTAIGGGRLLVLHFTLEGDSLWAAVFDPSSAEWEYAELGTIHEGSWNAPLQPLDDGRVLAPVGSGHPSYLFDPSADTWEEAPPLPYGWQVWNSLGLLDSGTAAFSTSVVFLYDDVTDRWFTVELPVSGRFNNLGSNPMLTSDGVLVMLQQSGFPLKTTAWIMRDPLAHSVPAEEWRGAPGED